MSQKQWLTDALDGNTPERTPYSLQSEILSSDDLMSDEWKALYDQGLALCHHVATVEHIEHGVESTREKRDDGGATVHVHRKETPVGTIERVTRDGWPMQNWITQPSDYKIQQWIVENTEVVARPENYEPAEALIGDLGTCVVAGSRTPAMRINVDWAGPEMFCMDVAMEVPELFELYEAQKVRFMEECELIAAGPGQYVEWPEDLAVRMLGPARYGEMLGSVYEAATPLLEASGKRVIVRYDGELKAVADQIAELPLHIIEAITEPPAGDMTFDECRAQWPANVLWAQIKGELYPGPRDELRQAVIDKRERAGKRAFGFEISEDLPPDWQETIPLVLKTLEELG